jgi:Ankyrin repeats (3 copies)
MTPEIWQEWQKRWRWMEALAAKRGWEVTPLKIDPPSSEAQVVSLELRHGLKVPAQLRELLTGYSARVQFGWSIPSHLWPLRSESIATSGGLRNSVWDIAHIDGYAIDNFLGWKMQLAARDISEEPNRPEFWDNQFPIADLYNGDMLTIDISSATGAQPVRYFSHDLEGLHARIIAPDLISFITEYSKVGCAGGTHDDWFRFIEKDGEMFRADGPGARQWFAWLAKDPNGIGPDEPPPVVVAKSAEDNALLDAARRNTLQGVIAALDDGAHIDAVRAQEWFLENMKWDLEYGTAIAHAAINNNIPMLELLLKRGATLNTRRLPLTDAVERSSLATVQWLLAHGARVNRWKDDRHAPLHILVERRGAATPESLAEHYKTMAGYAIEPAEVERFAPRPLDTPTYIAMLEALLNAGADPDAAWDNGLTMLMLGGLKTSETLLAHGADVHRRDATE